MKRLLGLLLGLSMLTSCTPTLTTVDPTDPEPPVQFTCATGECVITAEASITEAYIALNGPVTSRFCSGAVTAQPRPCKPVAGNWRALDLPPGSYGRVLILGFVEAPPIDGFADVNLDGANQSFRVELTP